MDPYRCKLCTKIGTFVYKCANRHLVCEQCVDKMPPDSRRCSCRTLLDDKMENPIMCNILQPCQYASKGCSTKVTPKLAEAHENECDWRPVQCIVDALRFKKCDWLGENRQSVFHMGLCHSLDLGAVSNRTKMTTTVPFDGTTTSSSVVRMIEVHGMSIVFWYKSSPKSGTVRFAFLTMVRPSVATKYTLTFRIEGDQGNAIKFGTKLGSSLAPIDSIVDEENCITVTHKTIQHYVVDGQIRVGYLIQPVCQ